STLANPNFASGYIGIVAPLWLWLFATSHTVRYRAVLGLAGVVLVAGLYGTDSLQGFIAAAAGIGVALVIMVKTLPARLRKPAFASLAGGGVFGLVLLAAGLGGVGPLSALAADSAFTVRSWYWGAAIAMWATRPLVGVGLDQYGSFYRTYRPLEDALSAPLNLSNDAAHSVPLMMLASGGIILAVAYVAFILYALWNAAGGVRRLEGDSLRLLGGVAGAWVAYQVQSLVSIDVPALAVAHFTLAGALVGLAGITTREVRLPWASAASNFRRQPALQWLAAAASGALLLVGLMLGTLPLRADVRAGQGARLLDAGRSAEAVPELQRAVKMAPWETRYRVLAGRALHDAGRVEEARAQFLEAVASEPRNIEALIWSGRMSALLEDYAAAEKWYGRVLAVEPLHPAPKVELARMQASRGELGAARELLAQALATDPNNAEALTLQDEIESLS
ncbi:MAG TPA: tetratricopeptide repeat protein, partial [Chloroflexota bacterium]|nr:tetratricopeptide repeat protein [Chloroflexota bacterium]